MRPSRAPAVNGYRPDIDGLRGVAVMSVVLFHAGIAAVPGGYVGVDVFFVISGFLITSLIISDLRNDNFSIVEFYERRMRRIFPALFACIAFCFALSLFFLIPSELEDFSESAVAAVLSVSNVFFWKGSGYFAPPSDFAPLLHTWSLGVEEQFYILHPLMLVLGIRYFKTAIPGFVLLLLGASLLVSTWASARHPSAGFYLAPSRAWELMIGAALALGLAPRLTIVGRNLAGAVGLAAIGWSIANYNASTTFPGLAALVPCFGAALVIHSGARGDTIVARLMSHSWLVFVGKSSYSLYLFHWPAIVFMRHYYGTIDVSPVVTVFVLGFASVVSVLSWRFVETPFRDRRLISRRAIFVSGGCAASAVLLGGGVVLLEQGLPYRLQTDVVRIAESMKPLATTHCSRASARGVAAGRLCSVGASGDLPVSFMVWGDSHAMALLPGVIAAANRHGKKGLFAAMPGCRPTLDGISHVRLRNTDCHEFNAAMLAAIEENSSARSVMLISRWDEPAGLVHNLGKIAAALTASGKEVVIVGPVPEVDWEVSRSLVAQKRFGIGPPNAPTYLQFRGQKHLVLDSLRELEKMAGVYAIYPHEVLCDREVCRIEKDGRPIYSDKHHLSPSGAVLIQSIYDRIFVQGS